MEEEKLIFRKLLNFGRISFNQMSTTELFLLTGETKTIKVPKNKRLFTPTGKPRKGKIIYKQIDKKIDKLTCR